MSTAQKLPRAKLTCTMTALCIGTFAPRGTVPPGYMNQIACVFLRSCAKFRAGLYPEDDMSKLHIYAAC